MPLISARFRSAFEVVRFANYRYYVAGAFVSGSGIWMQRIAVGWLTWELTGSGFWLGAVALADLFPSIVIGPFGGAVADRFDRMRLMKLIQILSLAQSVTLVVLLLAGLVDIWILFGLTVYLGVVQAFGISVQLALVPSLIPLEKLPPAVALNSVAYTSARFVGPALAGLVITQFGVTTSIACAAVSFVIYVVLLNRIVPIRSEVAGGQRRSLIADIIAGLRYAGGHVGIAAMLILLTAFSMGGRAITEIMPKFAAQVLGGDAGSFASLVAAIGVGGVAGGLWMSARGESRTLAPLAMALTLAQGLMLLVLPFVGIMVVALPAMVVFGFALSAAGIANQTQLQITVEGAMRGRLMSLYGMIFRGGPGLGALILGFASDFAGVRAPIVAAGLIVVAVVAWIWLRRDRIVAALDREPTASPV